MTSTSSVCINLERREMVILGTEYAGEMKKGIFSVMHYLLPMQGILTLHSGCNMGEQGDVSLFFGLSGTGALPAAAVHLPRADPEIVVDIAIETVAIAFSTVEPLLRPRWHSLQHS